MSNWSIKYKKFNKTRIVSIFNHGGVARLRVSIRPFKIQNNKSILKEMKLNEDNHGNYPNALWQYPSRMVERDLNDTQT